MKTTVWLALALVAVGLAGCTEEPEPPAPVECNKPGHDLQQVEAIDNETGEPVFVDQCLAIATVELTGVPATAPAYFPIEMTWTLSTDLEKSHSHNNGIRVNKESDPNYAGKVDGYGKEIFGAKKEHRDFVDGDFTTITWAPDGVGTYYVRAYAVSSAGNHWGPEFMVVVETPPATGNGKEVTISGGGLPVATSLSEDPVTIELGDYVTWSTDDPAGTWTITLSDGTTVDAGVEHVFTAPGTYNYEASNDLSETGFAGSISGQVIVNDPA